MVRASPEDGRAQAEDEGDHRRTNDRDACGARYECPTPKTVVRLLCLTLDQHNQLTEIARGLGQPSLTEAREDTALKMRHGGPDMVSGQLDLVAGRARACHALTVGVNTASTPQESLSSACEYFASDGA